jgi:hypothetical protein
MRRTVVRPIRIAIALTIATAALGIAPGHAAANLAPNPGFEVAAAPVVVPHQPLLPEGWAFEGAAILFDHTENEHHGGIRAAAISGSLSGKRRIGVPEPVGFQDNPANPVKDATEQYYATTPCWRTVAAIPVQGNKNYTLSAWTRQATVTELAEFGAVTKIRWVDATGVPVGISQGPKRPWRAGDPTTTPTAWEQIDKTVKSPAGAAGAILLLCQADDTWISQVVYDDVDFRAA